MTTHQESTEARLGGTITEQGGQGRLPAWVRILDQQGQSLHDVNPNIPLRGFPCDGSFEVSLPPGTYHLSIHRHISHAWHQETVTLAGGEHRTLSIALKPWFEADKRGYFCGESHDHLNHPVDPQAAVLHSEALGISYIDACQGWMTKREKDRLITGAEIARRLESYSTPRFHLYFGGERPKKRFGHVCWTNLTPFADPFGEYMGWHDPDYVEFCRVHRGAPDIPIQPNCPLPGEVPFATWRRLQKQGGVCFSAHPTSWWVDAEDQVLITTNIASDMIYGLLAGAPSDAMVVMGYDPDQIFYQNLWFRLLNEGYHIAACAETDGDLKCAHYIGQILGYVRTRSGSYSRTEVAEGIRAGHTLMTSGPFITFTADGGTVQMGDETTLTRPDHQLEIEAWSDPDPAEFLSGLVIYRNGLRYKTLDLRHEKPRHFKTTLPIREAGERAWYVVKAYGSVFPAEERFLDVFDYAALCEEEVHTEYISIRQVAITNPIYFLPPGWKAPQPVASRLHLRTLPNTKVVITELGEERNTLQADASGMLETVVSPLSEITLHAPGRPPLTRSVFLDYAPVARLVEFCYTGLWRHRTRSGMRPGQVPWWGFAFAELRQALQDITWTLEP